MNGIETIRHALLGMSSAIATRQCKMLWHKMAAPFVARVFVRVHYVFVYPLCRADNEQQHTPSKNRDMPDPDAVNKKKTYIATARCVY